MVFAVYSAVVLDYILIARDIVVPAIIFAPVLVSFCVDHAIFAAPVISVALVSSVVHGSSAVLVFSVALVFFVVPAISDDLAVAVVLVVFAGPKAFAALKIVDAPGASVARAVFDAPVALAIPVDDAARDTFVSLIPAVCTVTKVLVVEVVALC